MLLLAAYPLSEDHKPNRTDERQRIESAGGVVVWAGTWRVGGVLAVSRAFGKHMHSLRTLSAYVCHGCSVACMRNYCNMYKPWAPTTLCHMATAHMFMYFGREIAWREYHKHLLDSAGLCIRCAEQNGTHVFVLSVRSCMLPLQTSKATLKNQVPVLPKATALQNKTPGRLN